MINVQCANELRCRAAWQLAHWHISILNNYYLIFNVIIVIAANTIVTIQKRMVILDSWNSLSGLVNTTLHPGSIRLMEVRKWSCIGVLLKRRCFTPFRLPAL